MNRGSRLTLILAAALWGCSRTPMPPPAAGEASKEDALAPADVAARGQAPASLPPAELQPAEPVANDLGSAIADNWVGTWQGPEGTYLHLEKQEVGYRLVIASLDGPREFHAVAVDQLLQFERDGVTESLHAGDGKGTGMKWLAGKRDCLIVKPGEAYCRG
jgi:hypothetical protein